MSPERVSFLSVLAYAGPQTINRLAEFESVSAPAISRIVTALEALGLAERKRGRRTRAWCAFSPRRGRRLVEAGRRRRLELIARALSRLSAREIATLGRIGELLAKLDARSD